MSEPFASDDVRSLEPVHEHEGGEVVGRWTRRLVLFLRVMAGVSMLKGLYHWSRVCGVGVDANDAFQYHSVAWQAATVYFAVIKCCCQINL